MSTTISKGVFTFVDETGEKFNQNYNHFDPECADAKVKAMGQAIVANKEIFAKVPVALTAAVIVTTERTAIDLS